VKRRAFTLMELMISVVLIALISMYLYGALGQTRTNNKMLQEHTEVQEHRQKIYELLYRDFMESYTLNIQQTKDKHYHILMLQTDNSLYDIAAPYVTYYVQAESRNLVRLESAEPIVLPVTEEARMFVHADLIDENVTDLNLYVQKSATGTATTSSVPAGSASADSNASAGTGNGTFTNHLFYLASKEGRPLLMELAF